MSDPANARPAICLNMIVRNEAHIVAETLDAVAPFISSWVVVDTGSDDGTQRLIESHMRTLGIPGELFERPWRDFGYNRTEALSLAQSRGDYIWVMDADDTVAGTLEFTELSADIYMLRRKVANAIYWRPELFRDGVHAQWEGVTHEAAVWDRSLVSAHLEGAYHIEDRQLSSRNLSGQKARRDLDLLLPAVEHNPDDKRSVFYLAQSYFDLKDFASAHKWYERRVEMGGWDQEVYYAMYRVAESMAKLDMPWSEVHDAYLRAWEFRPTRVEALYAIALHYRVEKRYQTAYMYAERAARIPLPEGELVFVYADIHGWRAIEELVICGWWLGKKVESFRLCRRLLARPAIPDEDRQRIARNRDFSVPAMIEAASSHPKALLDRLSARSGDTDVTISLVASVDRAVVERTLNSFLQCCTDISRVGRFLVLDAGLSDTDRSHLGEQYEILEFVDAQPGEELGSQLASIRERLRAKYWLHLGNGWQFFAPDTVIGRLVAVLQAESQVLQVGVNFADATELTGNCAPEEEIRRAPRAGRYLLTSDVARGPAMFDTARLDQIGGFDRTQPDPLGELGQRAAAAGQRTATLDEVLCVAQPPSNKPKLVGTMRKYERAAPFNKIFNVSLHRTATQSVNELLLNAGIASVHWPVNFNGQNYENEIAGRETDLSYVAATLGPVIEANTAIHDVPTPALYDVLDARYPDSAFILLFRNPFDWVRSVRAHIGDRDLHPFERVQYWRYLSNHPQSLSAVSDHALCTAVLNHYRDVVAYFENRDNFLFIDLSQPDVGQNICSFLGLPPEQLPHVDESLRARAVASGAI